MTKLEQEQHWLLDKLFDNLSAQRQEAEEAFAKRVEAMQSSNEQLDKMGAAMIGELRNEEANASNEKRRSEVGDALENLQREIEIRFRCIWGPRRPYVFDVPEASNRLWYWVWHFGCEYGNGAELFSTREEAELATINFMASMFRQLQLDGATQIVWRAGLEMEHASGGDRVPNLVALRCRLVAIDAQGRACLTWLNQEDGKPLHILTREMLDDARNGKVR